MSSRAKQNVRTSNIIQNMKHINSDDKTILNYISLLTAILDPEPKRDSRKYILPEMFDKQETEARIKEIDKIRSKGEYTEAQMISFNQTNIEYKEKVLKDLEKIKKSRFDKIKIKVINKYAGTVEIKDSIKDVAEEYDLNYSNLKNLFSYHKKHNNTEKIQYKGLILEKIK